MKKFEKIFFSMIAMIMMVTVGSVFTSCTNDDEQFPICSIETDFDNAEPLTRSTTSTTYYVSSTYKNAYKHIKQPDGTSCSWTAYTLAAAAIARGNSESYPSGLSNPTPTDYVNKLWHVRTILNGSKRIDSLAVYANTTDHPTYNSISATPWGHSDFDTATFKLLGERKLYGNDKPCLFVSTTSTGLGHYVIIWDIEWGGTAANSTVYVTDPNSGSKTTFSSYSDRVYSVNMQNLLQSKPAGQNYSFLFFN